MTPEDIKQAVDQALARIAEINGQDVATATDEQLAANQDAVREIIAAAKDLPASPDTVKILTEVKAVKDATAAEVTQRAADLEQVNAEAARLIAEMEDPPAETDTDKGEGDKAEDGAEGGAGGEAAPAADDTAAEVIEERTPELVASGNREMSRVATEVGALAQVLRDALTKPAVVTASADRPTGRTGRPATTAAPARPVAEAVQARVYGGKDVAGAPIASTFELAKRIHDVHRTTYQDPSNTGRTPIAHVGFSYPEARSLGQDVASNFAKMEAATAPQSLVAAGGLCAPLETLYDVEVIGSAARPVRDALARFQVDRGGITYRPNTSAATAVYGAGQWTTDDDEAADGREKTCYEVDCPGLETEFIWAAYLCLEFSNITTRFDPETTASNVAQGSIAHARLADNLLLSKIGAGSKLLTGAKVIGAVRDILANVDKTSAYYRNRHRIDTGLPLMWLAPAWVRFLMRADLARQMAAGDWKDALAPSDALIDSWFAARDISPVWHMDGIAGTDEVQTVTITGTPTGGTFTLTYAGDTTAAIAYNATAAQVRSALAALDTLRAEDITVTGGPGPGTAYVVTFGGGEVDGVNVAQMTSTGSFTGGTTPAVAVATTTGGDGAITVNGVAVPSQTYDNAAAGAAIPGFPEKIDSLLFSPGSWLFLDGGSLDLGLVRDSNLNARNRYRQFMETFEGAAFRGIESLRLVMEVEANGGTAGTFDPALITG